MASSRAVRRLLRLLPFLIRSNIRAVRRVPSRVRPHALKLLKVSLLMLALALLLTNSDAHWTFTTTPQAPLGEWVLPTPVYHYLGRPIEATLRFTGPIGVYVNLDTLPQEGETVGHFEVKGLAVRIYRLESVQITECKYTLQYLQPLEGVFTKRNLPEVRFEYRYHRLYKWYRFTGWSKEDGTTWSTKVYLLRRTRPGDYPFPTVGKVAEPFAFSVLVKVVGSLVLSGVFLFHLGKMVNAAYMKKKRRQLELADLARPRRELLALWARWVETEEYALLLKAAIIARDLEKKHLGLSPGELLPRLEFWLVTTIALYSGVKLSSSRVKEAFKLFLGRFPVRENAMLFVLGS